MALKKSIVQGIVMGFRNISDKNKHTLKSVKKTQRTLTKNKHHQMLWEKRYKLGNLITAPCLADSAPELKFW